ncbi:hypothetical protein like AT3G48550 [Hibiscus trionum]|uniref:Protein SHOOT GRAVITROPISM 5 n=1 Tax=Hibiscus trionum TaxID=183268 RepID=A0A9W7JEY9_HIBTR|nr:hypothetical protein like AT3G48550 [Hibiscus trionum]
MEEEDKKEMQLLPTALARPGSSSLRYRSTTAATMNDQHEEPSSLDLQLSINRKPIPLNCVTSEGLIHGLDCLESLRWQAAEQIRLAAIEKAYAERVRELTKREMEMAQSEFARAKHVWQRAREEVERAEEMKERARSTCMEITCQSCRQRFRP